MDVYKNIENVCIRSMRQEDLDEVIAMESLFFGAHPDLTAYKKACLRTGNIYMVAEINGCIIAYCTKLPDIFFRYLNFLTKQKTS